MNGIVISGTHSGCGKTTITLGILAAFRKKGLEVQPFKAGPDFIDAGLHKLITGKISRNLDLRMCGREYVTECFTENSAGADIAIVEGVMGMYDGDLSTAALARVLNLPLILVVDAYGMAESAGAVVKGFVDYRTTNKDNPPLPSFSKGGMGGFVAGVIFNRVASERHYKRLKDSIRDVQVFGYLPRNINFKIPHRHLGLTVAEEEPIDSEEINKLANAVLEYINIDYLIQKTDDIKCGIENSEGGLKKSKIQNPKSKIKIAVAYDKAFCFYYEDNLDLLRKAGAEIINFSPLSDSAIPDDIDALYFGGGYPELHAKELSDNRSMLDAVRDFSNKGMPVYAECGGFMYLTEGIYDFEDNFYPLVGRFPFKTKMKKGRVNLGYRDMALKDKSILGGKGDLIRGHEFHYSEVIPPVSPLFKGGQGGVIYSVKDGSGKHLSDEGYRVNNTFGSYIHIHFGSNDKMAKSFVEFCNNIKINQVDKSTV